MSVRIEARWHGPAQTPAPPHVRTAPPARQRVAVPAAGYELVWGGAAGTPLSGPLWAGDPITWAGDPITWGGE